ncbi:hypothetical protein C7E17_25800, partial [Stenotrophomonas maltophilia]
MFTRLPRIVVEAGGTPAFGGVMVAVFSALGAAAVAGHSIHGSSHAVFDVHPAATHRGRGRRHTGLRWRDGGGVLGARG